MRDNARREMDTWSTGTILKYTSLQFPSWLLLVLLLLLVDRWIDISPWTMAAVIALWIGKDIVMFPFVWRAYDPNPSRTAVYGMIGEKAIVKERLSPTGYVQVRGELWRAELPPGATAVEKGQTVRVLEVKGLTLLVQPEK